MNTGENESDLRKISDFVRYAAIVTLLLHFYFYCYEAFKIWGFTSNISDNILKNIFYTGLFSNLNRSKLFSLSLLIISLTGTKGKKEEKITIVSIIIFCSLGLTIYFTSYWLFQLNAAPDQIAIAYMTVTSVGFLLVLAGGAQASRIIKIKLNDDIFNDLNETFPQEERLLQNEYSINLPTRYNFRGEARKGWLNIINPFRGILILGSPGSGKTYFIVRHIIRQHIEKGFAMFIYDYKFDDLSVIAYNHFLKHREKYPRNAAFYLIHFDDLSRSHRCNPLAPETMVDITDAAESARTILLGLNREWLKKLGDFWVESAITFVTAVMWFLRKYEGGVYCTLPHVIEMMQVEYEKLFAVLRTEPEITSYIGSFISAYENDVMETLDSQIASAKIAIARLSSPIFYYVLSGNDFSLDINNPDAPKIVCMGNNPEKVQTYGAVLSLYINRMNKMTNKKGRHKLSKVYDEFSSITVTNMDSTMATERSNKSCTTIALQDFSQLKKDYGRDQAEVILNIAGNVISGQENGDTAKLLAERFPKILQNRESISINSNDTSFSKSKQLEQAVPPSKIAALSSGEFVALVADDPRRKIKLKLFHGEIVNDHEAIEKETGGYKEIPSIREITTQEIQDNYMQVKLDIENILCNEMEKVKELKRKASD